MVLPLAVLLAYCSGPNNTQTTTDTDMNGTSGSVSASTTGTTTDVSTSTESGVSATTGTTSAAITGTTSTTQDGTDAHKADIIASASASNSNNTVNIDPSDPMYQHFQRVNGQSWTWDMNYPGYDRPTAGTYNAAVNGNWQLVMTPELVSAWRGDNSRSLWSSGYAYDGRYLGGNTYLSASESFNTRSSDLNGSASVQVNGSSNAGTLSSSSTTSSTSSLNNNASANSSTANQMNGSTSTTNTTTDQPISGTSATTGTTAAAITGSGSATTETTSGSVSSSAGVNASSSATVSGSTDVNSNVSGSTSSTLNGTTANMDVNSVNYNAANGNLYQMPKFNLYLDNGSFTGYTGCNSVSGRVSVSGNSLRFLNTEPSTSIDCLGGLDQTVLLDLLRRVDSYSYVGDELQLMQGNQVLLRFKKGGSASGLQ